MNIIDLKKSKHLFEEIVKMLNMRNLWYEQTSSVSVDTNALAVEQIADWIIQQYKAQVSE